LLEKFGAPRIAKFAVASGVGFLVAESILVLGIFAYYHTIEIPSITYSSLIILGLDVLSFGTGVTVAFVINERVTVKREEHRGQVGLTGWIVRWCKYQLASLLGNAVIVGVQLVLLATIALSPAFGSIVGAVVSYPLTFAVAMRFVWGTRLVGAKGTRP